jgi:hypothetical protein
MISNIVAVLLTLSLPRLLIFIKLGISAIGKAIEKRGQGNGKPNANVQPAPATPLQTLQPAHYQGSTRTLHEIEATLVQSSSVENAAARLIDNFVLVRPVRLPGTSYEIQGSFKIRGI